MAGSGDDIPSLTAAETVSSAVTGTAGDEGVPNRPEDGPVFTVLNKRLRALKKKANRIVQIEEAKASGKTINKEQEDVLRSKATVLILIDEYEKLRAPLQMAVKEELANAENGFLNQVLQQRAAAAAAAEAEAQAQAETKKAEENGENVDGDMPSESALENSDAEANGGESAVLPSREISRLVELLYFGALFDTKAVDGESLPGTGAEVMRWRREQERNSCLSYDAVAESDVTPPLTERDLDAVSALSRLLTTRSPAASNHKEAVEQCLQHATKWLSSADEPIDESLSVSYAAVKERLSRIISSEFFTTGVLDVNPEVAAAAAASGQYVSEPLPGVQPVEETGQSFTTAEQQPIHYAPQDQAGVPQYYAPPQYAEYGVPGQDRGLPEGAAQHMLVSPVTNFVPQGGFTVMDPSQQVHPQYASHDAPQADPVQQQQEQQPVDQSYLPNGIQYADQQSLDALQQQQQQQQAAAQANPQLQPPQQQQAPGVPGVPQAGPVPYGGASRGPMGGRLQGSGGRGYGGRGRGGRGGPRGGGGRGQHYDQPAGGYGQGGYRGGGRGGRGSRSGARGGGHPAWAGAPANGTGAAPVAAGPP